MSTYQVVEKFVSINGEGRRAGELAAFIRFKGCNLQWAFSASPFLGKLTTPFFLMSKIISFNAYAGSRAGLKSIISICELNADATQAITQSRIIFDGHEAQIGRAHV